MTKKVTIKPLSDDSVKVNNKVVYRDSSDKWIACSELSEKEAQAFSNYKSAVIDNIGICMGIAQYQF